jgi:hypothetical protein
VEKQTRDRVKEITQKQSRMMEELRGYQKVEIKNDQNPLKIKLERMEKKLESMRNDRLVKETTTKPMPKFMMFMQQNLMNQMMLAASTMNEQPLNSYPNIIPVPVNAEHRILPISNNPLVNFEKHQPMKPKNLDLNFDEINTMLLNDVENKPGEEVSVDLGQAGDADDEESETESESESEEEEVQEDNKEQSQQVSGPGMLSPGGAGQGGAGMQLNIISPATEMESPGMYTDDPSPDVSHVGMLSADI